MITPLLICVCGSTRRPYRFKPKGRKSYSAALRCPHCGFTGRQAFDDEAIRDGWNAAVRAAKEAARAAEQKADAR